jgi:hypothetical protein
LSNTNKSISQRPSLILTMAAWTLLWIAVVAVISFTLKMESYDSLKLYYFTCAYYVVAAGVVLYYYKVKSVMSHHDSFQTQSLLIVILYICSLIGGVMLNQYFPISGERQQQIISTGLLFPLWKIETWSIKLSEIIFQQAFIFSILQYIDRIFEYSKQKKMTAFALSFTILHFPLLYLFSWRGLYFIVPSFFAGFIFSYLILSYRWGLFYSFLVHIGFYFLLGSVLRYIF